MSLDQDATNNAIVISLVFATSVIGLWASLSVMSTHVRTKYDEPIYQRVLEYQGVDCWKKSGFSKNLTVNKRHESLKSINYPDLTPMNLKEDNEKYILHK